MFEFAKSWDSTELLKVNLFSIKSCAFQQILIKSQLGSSVFLTKFNLVNCDLGFQLLGLRYNYKSVQNWQFQEHDRLPNIEF